MTRLDLALLLMTPLTASLIGFWLEGFFKEENPVVPGFLGIFIVLALAGVYLLVRP